MKYLWSLGSELDGESGASQQYRYSNLMSNGASPLTGRRASRRVQRGSVGRERRAAICGLDSLIKQLEALPLGVRKFRQKLFFRGPKSIINGEHQSFASHKPIIRNYMSVINQSRNRSSEQKCP